MVLDRSQQLYLLVGGCVKVDYSLRYLAVHTGGEDKVPAPNIWCRKLVFTNDRLIRMWEVQSCPTRIG